MQAIHRFDEHIRSLGIPIDGVSGTGPTCRIDFKAAATQAQRDQGNAERLTFDWLDTPDPNHIKFLADVLTDASVGAMRTNVAIMGLYYLIGHKGLALLIWELIKGGAAAPTVRTHATNNNFTLPN